MRQVIFIASFVVALTASPGWSDGWTPLGPWIPQSINSSAADPHGPSLYIMTCCGLFRSTDGAASWSQLYPLPNWRVLGNFAVGTDPTDSAIIYAGLAFLNDMPGDFSSNQALMRSDDGGMSWTVVRNGIVSAIANDGVDTLWVLFNPGELLTSRDHGETWTAAAWSNGEPRSISFAARKAIVGNSDGALFITPDGGQTWSKISSNLPSPVTAATGAPDGTIFAATYANGIYRSTNYGANWSLVYPISDPSLINVVGDLAVDARSPADVYALRGKSGVIRSHDGGTTWQPASDTTTVTNSPSGGMFLIAGGGSDGAVALVGRSLLGGAGGVLRSTDRGDHWSAASRGITGGAGGLTVDFTGHHIYASGSDGLYATHDGGTNWSLQNSFLVPIRAVAMDPEDPERVLVSSSNGIFLKTGSSWSRLVNPNSDPQFVVSALAIDPVTPGSIYLAGVNGQAVQYLYRSRDAGITWQQLLTRSQPLIRRILIDPYAPDTIVIDNGMSVDGGVTWTQNVPAPLLIQPGHPSTFWFTSGLDLLSMKGGGPLTMVSTTGLPDRALYPNPQYMAVDAASGILALALVNAHGTIGSRSDVFVPLLYTSSDGGKTWAPFRAPVASLGGADVPTISGLEIRGGTIFIGSSAGVQTIPLQQPGKRRAVAH
jgi:photosystem II stability/assembly factor-like uncharacterized protein